MMLLLILLMMRVLFSFLLKLNPQHLYTFTSPLQQTQEQNHRALRNCYIVKNMLKLLAFKWLLFELLLETELRLILWFSPIKLIGSFLKFKVKVFNIFIQTIPLQLHLKNIYIYRNVPFPSTDVMMVALFCFSSVFSSESCHLFLNFLNKIVKSSYKTAFSKFHKGYICYIFLI